MSADGETLMATGTYPPQVRAYELRELSLKFSRHFTADVVQFQILSPDWKKVAFLLSDRQPRPARARPLPAALAAALHAAADRASPRLRRVRTIEFHSQFGRHHKSRIPHAGRALAYQRETCDLLSAGMGLASLACSLVRGWR